MLQIRLKKDPSSEGGVGSVGGSASVGGGGACAGGGTAAGGGAKPSTVETVTVACPEHLVLADLPVAMGLGTAAPSSHPKIVGRKSRRQLGERVHFCVRCDFPIAIYGRLSPCEHAFCLDCARSDSICYLCDEQIQKIVTIKMMEGIFICAAPHCLKSFMKRTEFESHIHESHADLLHPKSEKEDGNESDSRNINRSVSEPTARGPPRQVFSPTPSQLHDREDKLRFQPSRDQPPFRPTFSQESPSYSGHAQNIASESQSDPLRPPGFDRPAMHGGFHPQSLDGQSSRQDSGQYPGRQPGILTDLPFHGYPPMHPQPQPTYGVPGPSNPMMMPQQPYGLPSFPSEGGQPFFGSPADMIRLDSGSEAGHEPGFLLGLPPGTPGGMNFGGNYPPSRNPGMTYSPFEPQPGGQAAGNAFGNSSDDQEKTGFYQNEYFRNPSIMVRNTPPKPMRGGGIAHINDGKGILTPQPLPVPLALPMGAHSQIGPGRFYQGDMGHDGQRFGWPHEKHDSYGSSQD